MSETPISKRLNELIGQYGLQCSESKELAPTTEFADQLKLVEKLERDLATAQKECEELREQICKDTFEVEAKLRAEVAKLKAERDELRAKVPVWRPIETAPKDGSRFLSYDPNFYSPISMTEVHNGDFHAIDNGGWDTIHPVGWMPLPKPPKENA